MKNNKLFRLYLGMQFLAALLVSGDLYNKFIHSNGIPDGLFFAAILFLTLSFSALLIISLYRKELIKYIEKILTSNSLFWILVVLSGILLIESGQDILFLRANLEPVLYGRYQDLLLDHLSILVGVFFFSVTNLIFLFTWGSHNQKIHLIPNRSIQQALIPFSVLIGSWGLIQIWGLGNHKNLVGKGFIQPTNAPLIGIQVILILVMFLAIVKIIQWGVKKYPGLTVIFQHDLIFYLSLWGLAFVLWMKVPIDPNFFFDNPRPPNFEIYLNSDSLYYEIEAQRLLVGEGFTQLSQHPFYSMFLAVLHQIGGEGLLDILWMQVALLSFIPVLIFKLTSLLHNKISGLFVAFLYIFRQRNSLLVSENISVSNVKMVMTESLALLCLLLFLYLSSRWIQDSERGISHLFAGGGVLGIAILIRVEYLVIIPIFLLLTLIMNKRKFLEWAYQVLPFLVGLLLMVSPWIFHNWRKTGQIFIAKPEKVRGLFETIHDQLILKDHSDLQNQPVQNNPNGRLLPTIQPTGEADVSTVDMRAKESSVSIDKDQTGYIFSVLNHFSNDFMQMFLYLPSNHQPLFSLGSVVELNQAEAERLFSKNGYLSEPYLVRYVLSLPYWQMGWNGDLVPRSVIPLLLTLFMISVGVIKGLKKDGTLTWLLILMAVGYISFYSIFRSSGGRFVLGVDWVPLMFYGIGIIAVINFVTGWPGMLLTLIVVEETPKRKKSQNTCIFIIGPLIFLMGLSLPLADLWVPDKYSQEKMHQLKEKILSCDERPITGEIQHSLLDRENRLFYGKAIYPRYFLADERMPDDRDGEIPDYSYARLEFYLVGTDNTWVTIPMNQPPDAFPNGSEIILWGSVKPGKIINEKLIHDTYIKAKGAIIFGKYKSICNFHLITCQGDFCD